MIKSSIAKIAMSLVIMLTLASSSFAQDNRQWWNSLPTAWKKIFQQMELKGRNVDPTDEQLQEMVTAKHIDCNGNKEIENLKPLARLTLIETIDCSNTNITSLDGIEGLSNLTDLDCSNNDNINSLIPVTTLMNLTTLNCGNTMVKSLAPLRNHTKLRKLDVHFCTVNNLGLIGELKNLIELNVSQNQSLFSLNGVEKLTSLVQLDCSETNVNDLTPLTNMKALETINLAYTKVPTLRPLQNVRTLKEVDCSDTKITAASLDYFYSHLRLQFLRARNLNIEQRQIDDFTTSFTKRNVNCDVIITKK